VSAHSDHEWVDRDFREREKAQPAQFTRRDGVFSDYRSTQRGKDKAHLRKDLVVAALAHTQPILVDSFSKTTLTEARSVSGSVVARRR
jgi:hypothetical protein